MKNSKVISRVKPIAKIVKEYGLTETAILWNNENNLGPSPVAMQRVSEVLSDSHLYPDPACIALRTKIAEGVGCELDNIIIGNGSEGILANMYKAFFSDGDELLTSEGSFVAVYIWARANNIPFRLRPLTSNYAFDLNDIYNSIGPKTKMIYLANPNNPTGAMIEEAELRAFIEKCLSIFWLW